MPKFLVSSKQVRGKLVDLSGENHRHIVKVLRFKEGQKIELFDENSITYQAIIKIISSKKLTVEIYNSFKLENESNLDINLFQSIIKGNKMDIIVQKCCELGVKSITPIYTERTVVRHTDKMKRWIKIAMESCKQSGRGLPVKINEPKSYDDTINNLPRKALNLLFDKQNGDIELKKVLGSFDKKNTTVNLIIGPEGGFSKDEIKASEDQGIKIVSLGPRTLRTETASIASVSIIQFCLGDI